MHGVGMLGKYTLFSNEVQKPLISTINTLVLLKAELYMEYILMLSWDSRPSTMIYYKNKHLEPLSMNPDSFLEL